MNVLLRLRRLGFSVYMIIAPFLWFQPVSATETPEGVDSQYHSVAYISTRNQTGQLKPGDFFGDERSRPRYGICEFEWNSSELLKGLKQKVPFYVAEGTAKLTGLRHFSEQYFWDEFRRQLGNEKPVLYVHGYNIGFEKGCSRSRVFQESVGLQRRLILFSWPSDGSTLNYTRDEADIGWAVHHLENTLLKMSELFGEGGFDVVGHSLGGRGVSLALALLSGKENLSGQPLIDQLILSAADIDAEVFIQRQQDIRTMANHATIYVSDKDYALTLSREVHGYPRLGEAGEHLSDIKGFDIIEVSDLPAKRISGHLYHLANEAVIKDFSRLLNYGLPAEERKNLQRQSPSKADQHHWKITE